MLSFFFHPNSGSGHIRGYQIGTYLGARLNPESDFETDTCIYVKMRPPEKHPADTYLDIVDGSENFAWLKEHPSVKIIASSMSAYIALRWQMPNTVIYIPQHHCNYERIIRTEFFNRYGVVGEQSAIHNGIEKRFPNFYWCNDFTCRQDVVEAYQKIDIQVIWRRNNRRVKNALKIINAASFGIPTIAKPEYGFAEMAGFYTPIYSMDDIDNVIKNGLAVDRQALIKKADNFHIDNISKLYSFKNITPSL